MHQWTADTGQSSDLPMRHEYNIVQFLALIDEKI
jgi:hypothetical protein